MCQALMEIMKPEIEEVVDTAVRETTERAIKVAVEMLRNLNLGNPEIKEALQKNYNLSEEEALSYLKLKIL